MPLDGRSASSAWCCSRPRSTSAGSSRHPSNPTRWLAGAPPAGAHYGEQRVCPLSIELLDDAVSYEAFPDVRVPTLVLHGRRDAVVDPALSEIFARGRPHVERELLDSDHELRDVLEPMWERIRRFLRLPGDGNRTGTSHTHE
jgi:pimeloyl-ACP methyl ester carboxylesterase